MIKLLRILSVLLILVLVGGAFHRASADFTAASMTDAIPSTTENIYTVSEGVDYSTRVLRDVWDMSEFSDVYDWINHIGDSQSLLNIQVADGLFSALTQSNFSEFYALFPGYIHGTHAGLIGAVYPIDAANFSCYYMAMSSTWSDPGSNYFLAAYLLDKDITQWNNPNGPWGAASANYLTKDIWKLYQVDLNNPPLLLNKPWSYSATWQGLRITPSVRAGTQFSVDWIRLTDCNPVIVNLSGLPAGEYALWVGVGSPERQMLAVDQFSPDAGGAYNWDVQGLAPGVYPYYVRPVGGGAEVQTGQVTVVPSPIVDFVQPSPYSGEDYSTRVGYAWDMSETEDMDHVDCADWYFYDGIFAIDTKPPWQLPSNCVGSGANEADPRMFLNTPDHGNMSEFRYLSMNTYMSGAWPLPEMGMIGRLIWRLDRPGLDCFYTSREVVYDVGWHTLNIDLYNSYNGLPIEVTPSDCPLVEWRYQTSVGPLVGFRFDPNENITGDVFHQEFDWIRLTKMNQVAQGQGFTIKIRLNKPPEELTSLSYYYTTDLADPIQHPAQPLISSPLTGENLVYLPLAIGPVKDPFVVGMEYDLSFTWDTAGVALGEYFVCAAAGDGYSIAVYCSESLLQVVQP